MNKTYMDVKIECRDSDGKPATCNATVSIGEFDGLVLFIKTPFGGSDNITFTVEQAKQLRATLDAGVKILTS